MNAKDRVYNRRSREMKRRFPDWRMRPISVDGRDNTTRLERGPQGSGGDGAAGGYAHRGGLPIGGWHRRRAEQTRYLFGGMAGSALTSTMLRKAPYRTVRCLMLRAGLWENPMSGILGGRLETLSMVELRTHLQPKGQDRISLHLRVSAPVPYPTRMILECQRPRL